MSLEHILRNLNDIRVFDLFSSCQLDKKNPVDIDEILEMLEYPYREYIQIEDSVNHLVEEELLAKSYNEIETTTGCLKCSCCDKSGLSRLPGHETHKPEIRSIEKIPCYYLNGNSKTGCYLVSAVMASSFRVAEQIEKEESSIDIEGVNILTIDNIKTKVKKFEDKYSVLSKDFYKLYKEDRVYENIEHFDTLVWAAYYEIIMENEKGE